MSKIVGIDLGTSNSAAAVMMGGKPTIVPAAEGATAYGKAFPSVVAFSKEGDLLVGEPARRQAVTNADGTIVTVKRKMGTDEMINIHGKEYRPQQISAFILQKIKKDTEAFTGDKVEKAVITVPAYFDDNQRQATKDAGTIAGLDVVRIINEPTAAALTYGLDKENAELKIMVFDLGGGTLDVTIMEMGDGVFKVMSTSGDTHIGGTDMDKAIVDYVNDEFRKKEGIDLSTDTTAMTRVREAAEKAKIELSNIIETEINLPFIAQDASGSKNLEIALTRAKLEELVRPIVESTRASIEKALSDAELQAAKLDKVIMVGGPTRMPLVREFVGGVVERDPESGVDPMEAVAMGAAVQAGIIGGDVTSDIVLLDVTPLTLGSTEHGGLMVPIIERNTAIPTSNSTMCTTVFDYQTSVTVDVVQGERPMAADNVWLGSLRLTGIPPAPRGVPSLKIKFDIDANGILNVTAKDLGTQKKTEITIESSTKLSDDEIEELRKDAEVHVEEDNNKKIHAALRNEVEKYIYDVDKMITQNPKGRISHEDGVKISELNRELREAHKHDTDDLKERLEELRSIVDTVVTKIYERRRQRNRRPPK